MLEGLLILIIALLSGAFGIIVGAGGGFILVPIFLIFFNLSPAIATGTGLVIVMLNALSGVFGYVRQKRIDYRAGVILALGAIPGTFLGVMFGQFSSPRFFYMLFSIVIISLGIFLLLKKNPSNKSVKNRQQLETAASLETDDITDDIVDDIRMKKNTIPLLLVGLLLGIVSSYFGIGGGWLLVPILIYIFRFIPHYATATSIFSLCLYSIVGVITQIYYGNIDWIIVIWGGLGVLIGAQVGVYLSKKLSGPLIVNLLSILLIGVGIQLFFSY